MAGLACVVLAAGQGRRFNSKLPKPLQRLCGRAVLDHVLTPLEALGPDKIVLVVGSGREQMYEALRGRSVEFAVQEELLGTGHAALCAEDALAGFEGTVLVTCADTPLVSRSTLQRLVDAHRARRAMATILTTVMPDPSGYGRIVRSRDGRVRAIVEHRDATDEIRQIQEINAGIYCFDGAELFAELKEIKPDNVQGEYYLPDVIGRFVAGGDIVTAVQAETSDEVLGINTRAHLAQAEKVARDRARSRLLDDGVTLEDPASVYADDTVQVGRDTIVSPGAIILGETVIGEDCHIGPYASLTSCRLGNGVTVMQGAVLSDCVVGNGAIIGPYSHIWAGAEVGNDNEIASHVEVARSALGTGSQSLHGTTVLDARVGGHARLGAGAAVCGGSPGETRIAIADNAVIAAGSVVCEDVPAQVAEPPGHGAE